MMDFTGLETQIDNSNNKTIDRVIELPVNKIVVNENNFYDTKEISDLLDSIKISGQLEPLKIDQNNLLISGHRRLAALIELEIDNAKCIRKEYKNDTERKMELIISNQQRVKTHEEKIQEIAILEDALDEWQIQHPDIKINRAKQIGLALGMNEKSIYRIKKKQKDDNEDIPKIDNAEKIKKGKKAKTKELPHSQIMGNISYDFLNDNFEKEGVLRKLYIEYLNNTCKLAKDFIEITPTLNSIYNENNITISGTVRKRAEMEFYNTFCLMYKGE